jgi:N-acyl-D-amino-acid deacylase
MRIKIFFFIGILFLCFSLNGNTPQKFDIVIVNGTVIDGTGEKGYKADVGITGDRITAIGDLKKAAAQKTIDAKDLVISPGFIDIHTHCDRGILRQPENKNYILQGVTTVVGGNCGGSPLDMKAFMVKVTEKIPSTNIAVLIGHNTVRQKVMGMEGREPTPEELKQMENLVDEAMKDGAIGLSTGLGYAPGMFSKTDEVIALNKVAGKYGGMYASHIRDQGLGMYDSLEEAIEIGRKGGTRVQVSHLKLSLDKIWGEAAKLDAVFQKAIKEGIEIYSDEYPYVAASTSIGAIFPSWSLEGGKLQAHLKDPGSRARIKKEFFSTGRMKSYRNRDMLAAIQIASYRAEPSYEGKNLREILEKRGVEPNLENGADLVMEIQSKGGASCVFFLMDEKDVMEIMNLPFNMIGSDGGVVPFGRGVPHPRSYGTFPRVLGKYVREEKALSLETAIHKMTELPAKSIRLKERGVLKKGMFADIVVFDPESVKDTATYAAPHQYPLGILHVLVNGAHTVENRRLTENLAGRPLYGPGMTIK